VIGWQRLSQCHCVAGQSNEHKDDQIDVSSPGQVNDQMTNLLDVKDIM